MERSEKRSLVDQVFSWTVHDILNKDIFKEQIKNIPERFRSVNEYLNCFVPHLLEETRTELFSSFYSLSKAPFFYIRSMKIRTMVSNNFDISLMSVAEGKKADYYEPKCGDLIALTVSAKPRRVDDLNPLILAYVYSVKDELHFSVLLSKSISTDEEISFRSGVFLMTLTTNTRIWNALHNGGANLSLIKSVLQADTAVCNQK